MIPPVGAGRTLDAGVAKGIEARQVMDPDYTYSGEYEMMEKTMAFSINHQVAPAAEALTCDECHSADGRFDWEALDYSANESTILASFPPLATTPEPTEVPTEEQTEKPTEEPTPVPTNASEFPTAEPEPNEAPEETASASSPRPSPANLDTPSNPIYYQRRSLDCIILDNSISFYEPSMELLNHSFPKS